MSNGRRDPLSGLTASEWIAAISDELRDIGVGLAGIVQAGRHGFGLESVALIDFVRQCLHSLVEHGAKVRHAGSPSDPHRDIKLHYGNDTNAEVVEGVIGDWLASGGGDLEWGDFWFALPGTYDPPRKY